MTADLFAQDVYQPLASRIRPRSLEEFFGQQHLVGTDRPLRDLIEWGSLHSMIFWGPPGVGKTTLAKLLAVGVDAHFEDLSAVLSGVADIRKAIAKAQEQRDLKARKTVLFVDEVHRFNKSQQDAFLPFVEDGTVIFVGATTENPSFELNNALLSRCRVYVLKSLSYDDLVEVVIRGLASYEQGSEKRKIVIDSDALDVLVNAADGDARRALNLLEIAIDVLDESDQTPNVNIKIIEQVVQGNMRRFDKQGDYFYDQISALHKSIRGSASDASLYWLCRMLDGGCDPLYLARRLVRIANEDIGNADPRALELALNAWQVHERLGSPEGELALAQTVLYMAAAAKSNAVYQAFNTAMADIKSLPSYEVPKHLRNAPTKLMKKLDHGRDYRYAHDEDEGYAVGENYFPDELRGKHYYFPVERGLEQKIAEKLRYLRGKDQTAKN